MRSGAAIPVGPGGTGVRTFNTAPHVSDWSTYAAAGGSETTQDAQMLDAQVQLLSASQITNALPTTRTIPPAVNALARWNEPWQRLQTVQDGVAYQVIMATLQNQSGGDVTNLHVQFELGGGNFLVSEQVPGYRVYVSHSGESNSWVVIPALSGGGTAAVGVVSATVNLGLWASNAPLHLLWVDDNTPGNDPYYTLDNFAAWPILPTSVVTSVGVAGTGINTFSTFPQSSAWRMRPFPEFSSSGFASNITNAPMLDARVQQMTALEGFKSVPANGTTPPSVAPRVDYQTVWECLVLCPSQMDYLALTCMLRNGTGVDQFALNVSYLGTDGVTNGVESVPRLRAYYSLTGLPGEWRVIPEFCNATGALTARLDLGHWPPGAALFILWADDNGPFGAGISPDFPRESVNCIDDFSASPSLIPRLEVLGRDASNLTLGWPLLANGFELQSKTNLHSTVWQSAVTNLPPRDDRWRVEVSTSTNALAIFRLQGP